jgi:hypothetical protein
MADIQVLQLECPRGTDFAVQLFWTGPDGEGIEFANPARCDVRDAEGNLVVRFRDTSENPNILTSGVLKRSPSSSVIQLTASRTLTATLATGRYKFDVLATIEPNDDFTAGQLAPVVSGWFVVTPVQTQMT